jgi:hypothetical protein
MDKKAAAGDFAKATGQGTLQGSVGIACIAFSLILGGQAAGTCVGGKGFERQENNLQASVWILVLGA